MSDFYPSNSAVTEYQAKLAAQKAADKAATQYCPDDMVAVYDLKSRIPDYNMLLNMGAGRGGLSVYSDVDIYNARIMLGEAQEGLTNWYKPGDYHYTVQAQYSRMLAESLDRGIL